MQCTNPLKAFQIGYHPSGKPMYKICSYKVHHVEKRGDNWIPCFTPDLSPYREKSVREFIEVPCGNCSACRLNYSRQWADRCLLEANYHSSAYFATITYSDNFVPRSEYVCDRTGEVLEALTLRKRDFQLFMKRLRKKFSDQKIRFFACGEYGSETFRPHYHAIIFGLKLDDLQVYKRERGFTYYNSPSLQDCWSKDVSSQELVNSTNFSNIRGDNTPLRLPIGHIVVSEVTWETCAYTARYVMKKLKGPEANFYAEHCIEPPFTLMSRKPGIARQYYDEHPALFENAYINVSTPTGGRKIRPPKYFDKLYDLDFPEASAELKEQRRRLAAEAKAAKLASTSLDYESYLQVEQEALEDRIKALRRTL
uniref:Replication initiator protein n=2 Tax=unclassified Microvirus TaxID=338099 RepID=A0AAU8AU79_9VIRU